jgi:hypothetical protein
VGRNLRSTLKLRVRLAEVDASVPTWRFEIGVCAFRMVGRRREMAPIDETGARFPIIDSAFGHTGSESGIVGAVRALMMFALGAFRMGIMGARFASAGSAVAKASRDSIMTGATRALSEVELRVLRRCVVFVEGEAVGLYKPGASAALGFRVGECESERGNRAFAHISESNRGVSNRTTRPFIQD